MPTPPSPAPPPSRQVSKTATAIKDGVGAAANSVASEIADVANHIKDKVRHGN